MKVLASTSTFGQMRVAQVVILTLIIVSIFLFEQNNRLKNDIQDIQWFHKLMFSNDRSVQTVNDINKTGLPFDIVPNIVHYILFEIHQIEFAHFISLLSVLKNQRPQLIYIHCDCHQLYGNYYRRVLKVANRTDTAIIVRYIERPKEIFGHKLSGDWVNWHTSDIMRIKVLMQFGGIYLDRYYIVFHIVGFVS